MLRNTNRTLKRLGPNGKPNENKKSSFSPRRHRHLLGKLAIRFILVNDGRREHDARASHKIFHEPPQESRRETSLHSSHRCFASSITSSEEARLETELDKRPAIVRLFAHEALNLREQGLVKRFCQRTREFFLLRHGQVPPGHDVHFFVGTIGPLAFLWTEFQGHELGGKMLRVHALYIEPGVTPRWSSYITDKFEKVLTKMAKEAGAREIGFYTRRNPEAFVRRLNKTSPHRWVLDSHVVVRRV